MKSLRLLIVDDDPRMRESCAMVLQSMDFELPFIEERYRLTIQESADAEDAKKIIDNEGCDILLLDQRLPGMQGTDLLGYILNEKIDIQTIMITGNATLETAISATRNGAYEILLKPFTPEELIGTVFKAVKNLVLQRIVRSLDAERKKTRFEFIRVLSHELKSPLAAVSGYLSIMKNQTLGTDLQTYMQTIERSMLRLDGMRRLIMDMLDLTRIESGVKVRNIEPHPLADIASDCVDGIRQEAQKKNITVTVDIPHIHVSADRVELEIIITNLLTNAVKYNKESGTIRLSAHNIGHSLKIECSDTGIGMTKEERDRLFKEFTRIRNEKTKQILGNGLGLSIVKKITALYDGDISVESQKDKGSKFSVILPDIIN